MYWEAYFYKQSFRWPYKLINTWKQKMDK
jgi:hypothetical protein